MKFFPTNPFINDSKFLYLFKPNPQRLNTKPKIKLIYGTHHQNDVVEIKMYKVQLTFTHTLGDILIFIK